MDIKKNLAEKCGKDDEKVRVICNVAGIQNK